MVHSISALSASLHLCLHQPAVHRVHHNHMRKRFSASHHMLIQSAGKHARSHCATFLSMALNADTARNVCQLQFLQYLTSGGGSSHSQSDLRLVR